MLCCFTRLVVSNIGRPGSVVLYNAANCTTIDSVTSQNTWFSVTPWYSSGMHHHFKETCNSEDRSSNILHNVGVCLAQNFFTTFVMHTVTFVLKNMEGFRLSWHTVSSGVWHHVCCWQCTLLFQKIMLPPLSGRANKLWSRFEFLMVVSIKVCSPVMFCHIIGR